MSLRKIHNKAVKKILAALLVAVLTSMVAACDDGSSGLNPVKPGQNSSAVKPRANALNGAGASFPYPLYSRWISEYRKINSQVTIDYQSIGSGGGIKSILGQTVDFAGSDAPMKDENLAKAPGQILHIPTVLGSVAVIYNVAGLPSGLKLTPEVLAGIYLGTIRKWNDRRISELNPGLSLPAHDIAVVERSDGSGTTNIFTDYLSKNSAAWQTKVGVGTSVEWPVGIGAKGNEGVAGIVRQTRGSIGYVELSYALQNGIPFAILRNRTGRFIEPSLASTSAAAAGAAANIPADLRVSITDAPGELSYPIAGFTYLLVYKDQQDRDKGEALANFLWWSIHDGQSYAKQLIYAPLPEEVVKLVEAKLKTLNYAGQYLIR